MLEKKTEYKRADGSIGKYTKPNMDVSGKFMDKDEVRRIVVLSKDGVKHFPAGEKFKSGKERKFDSWSLFVKDYGDEDTDSGYYMNLKPQAAKSFIKADIKQFDVLELRKEYAELKKTGALVPMLVIKKIVDKPKEPSVKVDNEVADSDDIVDVNPVITSDEKELINALKSIGASLEICKHNFEKFKGEGKDIGDVSLARIKTLMGY